MTNTSNRLAELQALLDKVVSEARRAAEAKAAELQVIIDSMKAKSESHDVCLRTEAKLKEKIDQLNGQVEWRTRVLHTAGFSEVQQTEGEHMNAIECGLPPKATRMIGERDAKISEMEARLQDTLMGYSKLADFKGDVEKERDAAMSARLAAEGAEVLRLEAEAPAEAPDAPWVGGFDVETARRLSVLHDPSGLTTPTCSDVSAALANACTEVDDVRSRNEKLRRLVREGGLEPEATKPGHYDVHNLMSLLEREVTRMERKIRGQS